VSTVGHHALPPLPNCIESIDIISITPSYVIFRQVGTNITKQPCRSTKLNIFYLCLLGPFPSTHSLILENYEDIIPCGFRLPQLTNEACPCLRGSRWLPRNSIFGWPIDEDAESVGHSQCTPDKPFLPSSPRVMVDARIQQGQRRRPLQITRIITVTHCSSIPFSTTTATASARST
jgi:hypothetical protein